jgi:putative alpha-1,2-mannosidase
MKKMVITAKNANGKNIFVQSCKLNGKSLDRCWLRHGEIADGGELEFVMGPEPSDWAVSGELPPSMSDDR